MGRFWDLYALVYDSIGRLLPYQELISRTVNSLTFCEKKVSILDAGCGTGNLVVGLLRSEIVRNHQLELEGVDASAAMLGRARKKSRNLDCVRYRKADLNNPLPYDNGRMDAVVCLNALYTVGNPLNLLKEFSRVLKFGGLIILANPKSDPTIKNVLLSHWRMIRGLKGAKKISALSKTLAGAPFLLAVILLNFFLVKPNKRYYFMNEGGLKNILEEAGFGILALESAYGDTDVFAVAAKVIREDDGRGNTLSVEVARAKEDIEAIYRLRYDVYCDEIGSLDPDDYPDKRERDYYDDFSVHLLLRKGCEVVGALRLIKETPRGFLMEEVFALPADINRSEILEASRAIVRKDARGGSLLNVICRAGVVWSLEHGYSKWCLAPQAGIVPVLRNEGWNIVKIGLAKTYHNKVVEPLIRFLL